MKFIKTDSSVEYEGRAFHVRKDIYKTPSGQLKAYDVIDHVGSICVVPVDAQGNIIFVRQFRPAIDMELLELPAGTLDVGEDFSAACSRELREEIGMEAKHILRLGAYYLVPGYCTELMEAFLATDLIVNPLPPDEDEYLQVIKIPIAKAYKMAASGDIFDSKSLAALMLARGHLESNL